jgi:FHA domain
MLNEQQLSRLVVIAPEWLAGQVIRVRSTRMTVGRGQTDVYLDDPQVSRIHAALIARDEQLSVEDLGSGSGTTVNGMRVCTHVNRSRSVTWLGSAPLLLSWIGMQEIHLPHPLCPPGNRRFRRRSAPVISTLGS